MVQFYNLTLAWNRALNEFWFGCLVTNPANVCQTAQLNCSESLVPLMPWIPIATTIVQAWAEFHLSSRVMTLLIQQAPHVVPSILLNAKPSVSSYWFFTPGEPMQGLIMASQITPFECKTDVNGGYTLSLCWSKMENVGSRVHPRMILCSCRNPLDGAGMDVVLNHVKDHDIQVWVGVYGVGGH